MCLSMVCDVRRPDAAPIGELIQDIQVNGKRISMVDVMGIRSEVSGSIAYIDLVNNKIGVQLDE